MEDEMDVPDLSAVPLFPLPNVVLLPRAVLPLHIFEERYKDMMQFALDGNRQIAMALLQPGWEKNYHATPAIEPVVCVGTILTHEKLPDGRYNFLLQGHTRALVASEHRQDSFRIARLTPLAEIPASEAELADERERMAALFDPGSVLSGGIGSKLAELISGPTPTADLADLIAFHLLDNVRLKHALLAEGDVARRVTHVVRALEALQGALSAPATVNYGSTPSLN